MDALKLLTSDHNTMRELFEQFESAKEAENTEEMVRLQQDIFRELEVHTGIEEEVFYPEAKEVGEEAEELVAEGIEEHHVVDVLMEEIRALSPEDEAWAAKMKVLIENVEHHAEEEEQEMFPQLREVFGDERLERLGDELAAAKQRRGAAVLRPEGATREELYEMAKEHGVEGRSSMSKEELAEAVEES